MTLAANTAAAFATAAATEDKPNFVVCIADDLSDFDTQPYGATDIRTPQLVKFAAEGMQFTRCFVASPSCGPSRTALLTGLMPARNGAEPNHMPKRAGIASLPPLLRDLGYETAAFGKVAHNNDVADHGFDVVEKKSDAPTVSAFLTRRDKAKPLCLFLGTRHPHVPWSENVGYDGASFKLPPDHVDTEETRTWRTRYATDVTNADAWFGAMRTLVKENIPGNTVTVFTADHGSQWPFAKWNLYEAGIRVPFLAVWPGKIAPASKTAAMVQWPDILPTFIDLAGGKAPADLDGTSFAALLLGPKTEHRDRIFTTHSGDGGKMNVYPIRSVRTKDWKYIRNLHPEAQHHSHITRAAAGDGLAYWRSWQAAAEQDPRTNALVARHSVRPAEELYDLTADPHELNNLAAMPAHHERLTSLRGELDAWMKAQNDKQTVFGELLPAGAPADPILPNNPKKAAPKSFYLSISK